MRSLSPADALTIRHGAKDVRSDLNAFAWNGGETLAVGHSLFSESES